MDQGKLISVSKSRSEQLNSFHKVIKIKRNLFGLGRDETMNTKTKLQ